MDSAPSADQEEMRLNVRYRGLDVDRGRMSALELGPAIFAVGQMVGRTSRVLYGDAARVKVEVQADFDHASFGIDFLAVAISDGTVPPLTLGNLEEITRILGFTAGSLGTARGIVWLVRKLRGRKVDKVEVKGDHTIFHAGGDIYNLTVNEYNVYKEPKVREGLKALVDPMKSEGIDELQVGVEGREPISISRDERDYFRIVALPEEEVSVDESRRVIEVISPSFREENKWRFAEGRVTYLCRNCRRRILGQRGSSRHYIRKGRCLTCANGDPNRPHQQSVHL